MNTDINPKEQRVRDNREKNYAPIPKWIKQLEKSNDNAKYQQRQEQRAVVKAHITPRAQLTSIPFEHKSLNRRKHNKINALQRINSKCQVSPYLNLSKNETMSVAQRLRYYNSRHKCQHKRHYNQFETYKCEICKTDHLKFTCDHEREELTLRPAHYCPSCNHMMNVVLRDCACTVVACTFCKLTQYTHQEVTTPWCNCLLPPIVNNTDHFAEFLKNNVRTKVSKPKVQWVVDKHEAVTIEKAPEIQKPKRMPKFKKPIKVKKNDSRGDDTPPEIIEDYNSEPELDGPEDDPELPEMRDNAKDSCDHYRHEHLGLIDNYLFVSRYNLLYYFEYRNEIWRHFETANFAEMFSYFASMEMDDPYEAMQHTVLSVSGESPQLTRLRYLVRGTFRRCLRLMTESDRKMNYSIDTTHFTVFEMGRVSTNVTWSSDTQLVSFMPMDDLMDLVSQRVSPNGAAISGLKTLKDTTFAAAKSVANVCISFGEKILEFFKAIGNALSTLQDKVKSKLRYYFISDLISRVKEFLDTRPGTVIALLSNFMAVLTAQSIKELVLSLTSIFGIIFDTVGAAPSPDDAPLVEKLKKDLAEYTPEKVLEAYTKVKDSKRDYNAIMLKTLEILSDDEDSEDEQESEITVDTTKPLTVEKNGMQMINSSSILKALGYIFGFSKQVVASGLKVSFDTIRNFNVLCTAKKNIGEIFSSLGSILPQWLKTLVSIGNPKVYVATHITDELHPLGAAYHHAFTYWRMARMGTNVLLTNEQKNIAQKAYTDWVTYVVENKIPFDAEIKRVTKIIEDFLSLTTKPVAREREPFMVRFSGDSGVCKSTLWQVLISGIPPFNKMKTTKEIDAVTYTRQIQSEYWDGYNNDKLIVLYDDFNHHREEIDLAEIINIGSKAAYMPAMASIDASNVNVGVKGTQFTSPFVVMLSNNRAITPSTLFSAEAINRRRHIHFHLTFKKLNGSRMPRQPDYSHIKFELDFSASGQRKDLEDLTITEVKDMIAEEYAAYERKQDAIKVSVDNLLAFNCKDLNSRIKARKRETIIDNQEEEHQEDSGMNEFLANVKEDILKKATKVPQTDDLFKDGSILFAVKNGNTSLHEFYQTTRDIVALMKWQVVDIGDSLVGVCAKSLRFVLRELNRIVDIGQNHYGKILLLVGAIFTGYKAIQKCIELYRQAATHVTPNSGTNVTPKYKGPARIVVKNGNSEDITQLVNQNVIKVTQLSEDNQPTRNYQNGLFVHGSVFLITEHFFLNDKSGCTDKYVKEGTRFSIYSPFRKEEEVFVFDSSRIRAVKGADGLYADAVLYDLGNQFRSRTSLLKHFWEGTHDLTNRKYITSHINRSNQLSNFRGSILKDNTIIDYDLGPKDDLKMIRMHKTFMYDFRSICGDCGTPILCDDDSFQSKIIGMHVANLTKCGTVVSLGLIITANSLRSALEGVQTFTREEYLSVKKNGYSLPTPMDVEVADLPGKLTLYGIAKDKYLPPMKTDIVPSPLHDVIYPPTTKPANLNQFQALRDGVNIMKKGISKYANVNPPMDESIIRDVTEVISQEINHIPTVTPRRVLTMEEAINGVPGYPNMGRMNMSTSPGYPFMTDPAYAQYKGEKRKLFDYDEITQKYTPKPVLREMIEETLEKFKKGVIPDLHFVDCLKDERRPIAKVDAYKTRVFSICPVAVTIVSRMYMLPFTSHLIDVRLRTHMAMGMNKNSTEWTDFYNYLAEYNNKGSDADYTEFDGREHKRLMQVHYDMANNFYNDDEESQRVRLGLWKFVTESTHIYLDVETGICVIYCCDGGNPSGQGDTTPVNSTSNYSGLMYTWVILLPDKYKDPINFSKFCRAVVFGDDCVYTVKEEVAQYFTPTLIQGEMEKIGMKFGPSDKLSATFNGFKPLQDCTFLKNSTIDYYGWKVPRMEDDALFETINWIRQGKDTPPPEKCCEDNCNDVLRNSFFRGEQEYNEIRRKILKHKPEYKLLHYAYLRNEFLNGGAIIDPFTNNGYMKRN